MDVYQNYYVSYCLINFPYDMITYSTPVGSMNKFLFVTIRKFNLSKNSFQKIHQRTAHRGNMLLKGGALVYLENDGSMQTSPANVRLYVCIIRHSIPRQRR